MNQHKLRVQRAYQSNAQRWFLMADDWKSAKLPPAFKSSETVQEKAASTVTTTKSNDSSIDISSAKN